MEQLASEHTVKPPRRCAAWCSLRREAPEERMLCSALSTVRLAARWSGTSQSERCRPWWARAGPGSATKDRLSPSLCGLRRAHRATQAALVPVCPHFYHAGCCTSSQGVDYIKDGQKKSWTLLLLQVYFSSYCNVLEMVDLHCQTWGFFTKKTYMWIIITRAFPWTKTLWNSSKFRYFGIFH